MEMETLVSGDKKDSLPRDESIISAEALNLTLHQCARDGDINSTKLILEYLNTQKKLRRNINKHDDNELSPLHYAVRYGNIDIVKLLVENGAHINDPGDYGAQPLHFAAKYKRDASKRSDATPVSEDVPDAEDLAEYGVIPYLVERGADINAQDTYGSTPLHFAAMRGNDVAVTLLVQFPHIEVDKVDKTQMTALHTAARYNQKAVAEALINAGAKIRCFDDERCTPLFYACFHGCLDIVNLLFDAATKEDEWIVCYELVADKNIDGKTCLHAAVDGGFAEVAKICLMRGADVNGVESDRSMPLHRAAMSGNMECVKLLVDNSARIDAYDEEQSTPLHKAALYNHYNVVDYLIKCGARVNKRDSDSYTPLLLAALRGHSETIEILMNASADPLAVDKYEKTAIYLASEENKASVLKKLLEYPGMKDQVHVNDQYGNRPLHVAAQEGFTEIVMILLSHGADIMATNDDEETPIHLASKFGRTNVVRALVKADKTVVKSEDEDSNTPLHIAALHGHDKVGEILINFGADVGAVNNNMWTPLDCAAANGWTHMAMILLDSDSLVDPADKSKTTPLHLACRNGHLRMVRLLLQRNASVSQRDSDGNNCLDLAIDNNNNDVAMLIVSDDRWEEAMQNETLDLKKGYRQTPMRKLIRKMPEVAEKVLSQCLSTSGSPDKPDYSITFTYKYLDDTYTDWKVAKNSDVASSSGLSYDDDFKVTPDALPYTTNMTMLKKNHPLNIMAENNQEILLSHPVVKQLLSYKWSSFGAPLYYVNLFIYLIFLVSFTGYILEAKPPVPNAVYYNETHSCFNLQVNQGFFISYGKYVVIVLGVLMLLREIFQLFQAGLGYLTYVNLLDWVTYLFAILFVLGFSQCQQQVLYIEEWQWNLGSIGIFLAWIDLVLYVQKVPRFGIYVVMFTDILYTFIQFAVVFSLFIVAFAFGFFALLRQRINNSQAVEFEQFSNIGKSLMKTFVMMIGELEFDDIFFSPDHSLQFTVTTYLMFLVFLILGSIIIMNLLVGLAVDDIKEVQNKATLKRRAMQVDLVLDLEKIMPFSFHKRKIIKCQTLYPNAVYRNRIARMFRMTSYSEDINQVLNPEQDELRRIQTNQTNLKHKVNRLNDNVEEIKAQMTRVESMLKAVIKKQEIEWEEEDYQED
ncbi:transient receptor potential cation channel subfamily A member 1 homolog [Octopus vulgaris]|uniref:Transient receptor potential cation channel subfamily A member 1 homolog n=1 Tax=Octopus vulgaris TaxID=6645 RepID=A0A6C0PNG8_OCTVU|nr:transient receptor potential cation channel subfamily A member 1-like protein [Octopus vulgaris]CAI9718034.1 transient receptor potential cation channel subfamily A member 1 homolog [Octopus vulgaris]